MRQITLHGLLAVTLACGGWASSSEATTREDEGTETPAVEPPDEQTVILVAARQSTRIAIDEQALKDGLKKYNLGLSISSDRYCSLSFYSESLTEKGKLPAEAMELLRKLKVPEMAIQVTLDFGVLTDAVLPQLAELPIGYIDLTLGPKLTSQGFDVLSSMAGVRRLRIEISEDGDPRDEDFAKLAKLLELETLNVWGHPHSLDGSFLAAFNGHARLENLFLEMQGWNCEGLKKVQLLPRLKRVVVRGRLDAGKVAFLRANPQLVSVQLDAGGGGDDAMLALLAEHQRLQIFALEGETPKLTDAGLKSLGGLTSLYHLKLGSDSQLTEAGLAHLSSLTKLDRLSIGKAEGVTDAGMVHLAKLTNLRDLSVTFPKVTDAGMVHLGKLTNLTDLSVVVPNVTDAGLESLVPLKKLLNATVRSPKITSEGIEATKAKMSPQLDLRSE